MRPRAFQDLLPSSRREPTSTPRVQSRRAQHIRTVAAAVSHRPTLPLNMPTFRGSSLRSCSSVSRFEQRTHLLDRESSQHLDLVAKPTLRPLIAGIRGLSQPYAVNAHSHFERLKNVLESLDTIPAQQISDEVNEAFLSASHHLMDTFVSRSSGAKTLRRAEWQSVYHRALRLHEIHEHLQHLREMEGKMQSSHSLRVSNVLTDNANNSASDCQGTGDGASQTVSMVASHLKKLVDNPPPEQDEFGADDKRSEENFETVQENYAFIQAIMEKKKKKAHPTPSAPITVLDRILI